MFYSVLCGWEMRMQEKTACLNESIHGISAITTKYTPKSAQNRLCTEVLKEMREKKFSFIFNSSTSAILYSQYGRMGDAAPHVVKNHLALHTTR